MGGCLHSHQAQNQGKNNFNQRLARPNKVLNPKRKHLFECVLNNVKIEHLGRKYLNQQLNLIFVIEGFFHSIYPYDKNIRKQQKKLPQKNDENQQSGRVQNSRVYGNSYIWNQVQKFRIKVTSQQLLSKQLKVTLTNKKSQIISQISIMVLDIVTGPYHHNLPIASVKSSILSEGLKLIKKDKNQGRIIFDLHMTQILNIRLQCLKNQIEIWDEYPGEKYNFQFYYFQKEKYYQNQNRPLNKTFYRKNKESTSSYIIEVPLISADRFRLIQSKYEAPSPTLRQKHIVSNIIKEKSSTRLVWTSLKSESQLKQQKGASLKLPYVPISLKLTELSSQCIKLKLNRNPMKGIVREFGSCKINLLQIVGEKIYAINKKYRKNITNLLNNELISGRGLEINLGQLQTSDGIQKNLWNKGKKIGKCKLIFQILFESQLQDKPQQFIKLDQVAIFKQNYGYARTEDGIIKFYNFKQDNYKNREQKQQIKWNQQFFNKLQQSIHNIDVLMDKQADNEPTSKLPRESNQLKDMKVWKSSTQRLQQQLYSINKILAENTNNSFNYQIYQNSYAQGSDIVQSGRNSRQSKNFSKDAKKWQKFKQRLLQNQKILLNLLEKFNILISEQNNSRILQQCWKNIIFILKRQEMLVQYWEFPKEVDQLAKRNEGRTLNQQDYENELPPHEKQRIQMTISYYEIYIELLKSAIDTSYSVLDQNNESAQIYKAHCFFKIPIYREMIIKKLKQSVPTIKQKQKDPKVSQLPNLPWQLQKILQQIQPYEQQSYHDKQYYSNMSFKIITKQTKFYKKLTKFQRGQQINNNLYQFLENNEWFNQMVGNQDNSNVKDEQFYDFVKHVIDKYVSVKALRANSNINSVDLDNYYFPGYSALVRSYFYSFIYEDILQSSLSTILCAYSLLENQALFLPMIKILFKKVNIYDARHMTKLITNLCYFLHGLSDQYVNSIKFPYAYLASNLIIPVLSNPSNSIAGPPSAIQSTLNIKQTLIFLYNNYNRFHVTFRKQLTLFLLSLSIFIKLFYHWCFTVRKVFQHFIILKIGQDNDICSIPGKMGIERALHIMGNGFSISKQIDTGLILADQCNRGQGKDLEYYKRMKNKLSRKIKKLSSRNLVNECVYNNEILHKLLVQQVPNQYKIEHRCYGTKNVNNAESTYCIQLGLSNSYNHQQRQLGSKFNEPTQPILSPNQKSNQQIKQYRSNSQILKNWNKNSLNKREQGSPEPVQENQIEEVARIKGKLSRAFSYEHPINSITPQKNRAQTTFGGEYGKYFPKQYLSMQGFPSQQLTELQRLCPSIMMAAYNQHRELSQKVEQHYKKESTLPAINLGLDIFGASDQQSIDNKEMRPCQEDFNLLF